MTIEETQFERLRVLPRRQVVDEWSARYDSAKYPKDFYLQKLREAQAASTEQQLHECVFRLLQWKDGKIRKNPSGTLEVGGLCYAEWKTKPNTYAPEDHGRKLGSKDFYDWSKDVMTLQRFSTEHLDTIKTRFELWPGPESLVIPAFLLHILNPRVFRSLTSTLSVHAAFSQGSRLILD